MKYKKYIAIFTIFVIVLFKCNIVEAKNVECYYLGNGFAAQYDPSKHAAYIDVSGSKERNISNRETIKNYNSDAKIRDYSVPQYDGGDSCPRYLVLWWDKNFIYQYRVYATNDADVAANAAKDIARRKNHFGYTATYQPNMTEESYFGSLSDYKRTASQNTNIYEMDDPEEACSALFGDKNNEDDLAYWINYVLQFVRWIVPALVIAFGTLDMAKAAAASKEEEMKKAQKALIMRIIIGVAIFFVPTIVNVLMYLADIVWEGLGYTHCSI